MQLTYDKVQKKIERAIDQHFQESRYVTDKKYLKTQRLHYIGGIMQAALFILPLDKYYEVARYCYEKHGYDPGGQAAYGQMTLGMIDLDAEDTDEQ